MTASGYKQMPVETQRRMNVLSLPPETFDSVYGISFEVCKPQTFWVEQMGKNDWDHLWLAIDNRYRGLRKGISLKDIGLKRGLHFTMVPCCIPDGSPIWMKKNESFRQHLCYCVDGNTWHLPGECSAGKK